MSPRTRRIVIPLVVGTIAMLVVLTMLLRRPAPTAPSAPPPAAAPATTTQPPAAPTPPAEESPDGVERPAEATPEPAIAAPPVNGIALEGLRAVAPPQGFSGPVSAEAPARMIGSLDPRRWPMHIELSRAGAGIARIVLSEHWETVAAKREAERHYASLAPHETPPTHWEDQMRPWRYVLKEQQPLHGVDIPVLATHSITINGERVGLFYFATTPDGQVVLDERGDPVYTWADTTPEGTDGVARFETTIVNADAQPVLHITRQYVLGGTGDVTLSQRVRNLTGEPLEIAWLQYGPGDVVIDRSRYLDRRRARFGYMPDPMRPTVVSTDTDLIFERDDLFKKYDPQAHYTLWPPRQPAKQAYRLSWFGMTNRYFALVVHPVIREHPAGADAKALDNLVEEIRYEPSGPRDTGAIFTYLHGPRMTVEAGATAVLDLGVYAGPMNRHILERVEPYRMLGMDQLILYMMSTFCAICTFQWLAHWLMVFLAFLHDYMLFDWGLAIIALVIVVRTLLHPLTKKSQINMMRLGKQMQALQPEIAKLQEKYKGDPKKLQQEQLRLWREHGVNPLAAGLGCLPMFLQMPIWIALYAMLYFAFDIRHQPAFFGLFQFISADRWPFLADLSTGDHFFGEFAQPVTLWFWHFTGINVLPIAMAVVLYIHQKYMTPPPSATMTPEQIQQQKIMRVMMVVMLPLFLYTAPSGLTLYIMTSSIIGIIESRYIRSHVDQMDLGPGASPAGLRPKPKKPKDPTGRAYAEALERAKEKRKPPPPSFKRRK
jgi:YidC/Oxa1 family membrane protein insertase